MRSAGKVKIKIMKYEIVLLLHQSVQETLMMGANSGRHQEEEMKVSIMLIVVNIISIIVNMVFINIIINIIMMAEAQKPKTFRIATFYAQKLSGRSA